MSDAPQGPDTEPEPELDPPPGVRLEHPEGGVQVLVQIPRANRLCLAAPRLLFVLGILATILQAFRHHVFFGFWFIGLPFVPWLFGAAQSSLFIGEQVLRVDGVRWFGGSLVIPRDQVKEISTTRGGFFQAFQRVILVRGLDQRTTPLLVGLSLEQAEFIDGGLQRWLVSVGA